MKKKLLIALSMLALLVCLFALSVSAATTNEFGVVEELAGIDLTGMSEDSTARVVLYDGTEYHTYPAKYIVKNTGAFAVDFSKIKAASGVEYSVSSIIRIEMPLNVTEVTTAINGGKGGKQLIQVVFPENSVVKKLNWGAFENCTALQSINIPASVESFGNNTFNGCKALVSVTFALDGNLKSFDEKAFAGCVSLTEVVLPRNLEKIGNSTFYNCVKLEKLVLSPKLTKAGAGLVAVVGYNDKNSCPVIYMPGAYATGEGSLESGNILGRGNNGDLQKYIIFFTGTETQAKAFVNKYSADISLCDANIVAYDTNKTSPTDYLGLDAYTTDITVNTNRVIVYGYSECEAFYDGHSVAGEVSFAGDDYFESILVQGICGRCTNMVTKESIAPMFEDRGYSTATYANAITHGYKVNFDAIQSYKKYVPGFDFGVIAASNAKGEAIAPKANVDGAVGGSLSQTPNSYIDIIVSGITQSNADTYVVFCLYVTDGTNMYYLDNKTTSTTVTGLNVSIIKEN